MKSAKVLHVDDLRLDLAARRVVRGEQEIELGRLTFDLFAALAEAAPAALSSDDIVARVWDSKVVSDETLQQRVRLLRKALGEGSDREYVQTLRGFGYRLASEPVPVAAAAEPNPTAGEPEAARSSSGDGGRLLRWIWIAVAVLVLLLALTVFGIVARQAKRWNPEPGPGPIGRSVEPAGDVSTEGRLAKTGQRQSTSTDDTRSLPTWV